MELRELLTPIFRWWWLLVAATVVAAGFSLFASLQQPPIYRSSTTLMIGRAMQDPNPSDMQLYTGQLLATTYADIANREPVRSAAMAALGLDWLPAYVVRPVPNTQLLEIAVTDTDPARVQAVADELANQLILQSPTSRPEDQARQEFISQQLDDLEVKIQETQNDLEARQNELTNLTSARQIADTQNQIYAFQAKLDTLRTQYADLLASTDQGALNTLSVIEPAKLPTTPVGPNIPLLVAAAAVLALAVAVGAVYLLAYLDNSIKSPEEIKRLTGLPMLVGIPVINGEDYSDKLITVKQPRSPISEAYRSLRTGVQFSTIDREDSSALLITSPNPSEGKSITVANLAAVMAQAGHQVLIIDADLRRPVLHKIFEMDNHLGLTGLLGDYKLAESRGSIEALVEKYTKPSKIEGLRVLTSGGLPPDPSELLGSQTYRQLLAALKGCFDYVILDSPPALIVTDAIVLSTLVDGVILVVDVDSTHKSQLRQAVDQLRNVNAKMIGIVANRLSAKSDGYQNYYRYYYYRKSGDKGYGYDGRKSSRYGPLTGLVRRSSNGNRRSKKESVPAVVSGEGEGMNGSEGNQA